MDATFDYVIPIENKASMQWQAKLFHWSCMTYMRKTPIIMVMGDESQELLPGLKALVERGGDVRRAPGYVSEFSGYKARNTAGSLLEVESDADYIVLCDSDMIFVDSIALDAYELAEDEVSFEWIGFMHLRHESVRPYIRGVCDRAEIPYRDLEKHLNGAAGGVPHIIPAAVRKDLAANWLHCQDLILPHSDADPHSGIATPSMWSLVLATYRLGLRPVLTNFNETNFDGERPLPDHVRMIHYAYGGDVFDKRNLRGRPAASHVGKPGSIDEAVCEQLRSASEWYGEDIFA